MPFRVFNNRQSTSGSGGMNRGDEEASRLPADATDNAATLEDGPMATTGIEKLSANDVPGKSREELKAENNAAVDRNAAAIAEIVQLFGEDFDLERTCTKDAPDHIQKELIGRLRDRMARVATLEADLPPGSLATLFRALEGKFYSAWISLRALNATSDIEFVAKQLDAPNDVVEQAVARREHDQSRARKKVSDKANDYNDAERRKTLEEAQKLYLGKPFSKKTWNPLRAANFLLKEVRTIAINCEYRMLGNEETEGNSAVETIARWFRAAECGRNPSYCNKSVEECKNCDCPRKEPVQPAR